MADFKATYQAIANFTQLIAESKRAERALKSMQRAGDENSASLDSVGASADSTSKDLSRASSSTDKYTKSTDRASSSSKDLDVSLGKVGDSSRSSSGQLDLFSGSIDESSGQLHMFNADLFEGDRRLKEYHKSTQETSRDNDTLSRTFKKLAGDGKGLGSVLKDLGSGMGKVRYEAANFGAVLSAIKIPAILVGIKILVGWISALSAGLVALIPNLVQSTTLIAALPGLLVALGATAGAAVAGLMGVGAALKSALSLQQEQDMAKYSSVSATNAAADAERAYQSAVESQTAAQQALSDAFVEARYALQDLRMEQERGQISVKRAEIALKQAQRNLRELQTSPDVAPSDLEYQSAVLDVRDAQLNVTDAKRQNERTTLDLQEAEKKGVKNSDLVTSAQKRLEDATYALARAQQSTAASMDASTASADKFKYSMSQLTAEGRTFVRALLEWKPAFKEIRAEAQKNLLPYLTDSVKELLVYTPTLKRELGGIANTLGQVAKKGADMLVSGPFKADFTTLIHDSNRVLYKFGSAFWNVIDALRNVAIAARPVVYWISNVAQKWSLTAMNAAEAGRESGKLEDFFIRTIAVAKQLGAILGNLFKVLYNVGRAAKTTGQWMYDSIEKTTAQWAKWTGSMKGQNSLKKWFEDAKPAISESFGLLGDIAGMFVRMGAQGGLADLISQLRTQLLPAIETLFNSISVKLGPALIELLTNVVKVFTYVGGQSSTLVTFLNVLNKFLEIVLMLVDKIPFLNDALTVMFTLLGAWEAVSLINSVFKLLAKHMGEVVTAASGVISYFQKIIFLQKGLNAQEGISGLAGAMNTAKAAGQGLLGAMKSLITPTTAWIAAIGLAVLALMKVRDLLNQDNQMAGQYSSQILTGTAYVDPVTGEKMHYQGTQGASAGQNLNTLSSLRQSTIDANAAGKDAFGGDLTQLTTEASGRMDENIFQDWATQQEAKAFNETLDTVRAQFGSIVDASIQSTEAVTAFGDALHYSENLTGPQVQSLADLIDGVYLYSGGLDDATAAQVQAMISSGDFKGAQELLRFELNDGITSIEAYAEAFGDAGARVKLFDQTMGKFSKSTVAAFAEATGQDYKTFMEQGKAAFQESTAAGNQWVQDTLQTYRDWKQGIMDQFDFVGAGLEDLSSQQNITAGDIIDSLDKSIDAQDAYAEDFATVRKKYGDNADKLVEYFINMGMSGAEAMSALADANDTEMNTIIDKWHEGKAGQKDLADSIGDQLVGSLDKLAQALRNLPNRIAIALGLDTKPARTAMQSLIDKLSSNGITLKDQGRIKGQREQDATAGTGVQHKGGMAGSGPPATGPLKPDELTARLQKGEFVVQRGAVNPKTLPYLQAINRKKTLPAYHIGGYVMPDDTDALTSGVGTFGATMKGIKGTAKMKRPKFDYKVSGGGAGGASGGTTPKGWGGYHNAFVPLGAMIQVQAGKYLAPFAAKWFKAMQNAFGGVLPIVSAYRSYAQQKALWDSGGGTGYTSAGLPVAYPGTSNHGLGLAIDVSAGTTPWDWMLRNAQNYNWDPLNPYDPPHFDYVGPKFHKGGYVKDDMTARVKKGEFVLNDSLVQMLGAGGLSSLNSASNRGGSGLVQSMLAGPSEGPRPIVPYATAGLDLQPRGSVGNTTHPIETDATSTQPIHLDLSVDGRTLTRTVEFHGRHAKLQLSGRKAGR